MDVHGQNWIVLVVVGTLHRFSTGVFKRFRNPKDKRDFVTAGVSVSSASEMSSLELQL
jgi:hypothetical protein